MRAVAKAVRSLFRSREGASAIEFALVAPVFLSIVLSGLEAGWIMTEQLMLDRAVEKTVRLIRIGDADAPATQQQIKQAVCDTAVIIPACIDVITVEMTQVKTAADFPSTSATCVDRSKKVQPTVSFTAAASSSIMYIRACIVADPFTPGLGFGLALSKDTTGAYRLVSVGAFKTE